MDLSLKYLDWIKRSPRYFLPIYIFTGIVVFAPLSLLYTLGMSEVVANYRPYFGLVFSHVREASVGILGQDICVGMSGEGRIARSPRCSAWWPQATTGGSGGEGPTLV
jgi:hypothetical protein